MRKLMGKKQPRISLLKLAELDGRVREKSRDKVIFDLGKMKIKTEYGNYVYAYDVERCICDIIRSINREDLEQVKKVLRNYANKLDFLKLKEYAEKMNIIDKVNDYVGRYLE
jgi:hypothetical protein